MRDEPPMRPLALGRAYSREGSYFVPLTFRRSDGEAKCCSHGQRYYVALSLGGAHPAGTFFDFGEASILHLECELHEGSFPIQRVR